ncbi:MAG: hypothetical protein LBB73_07515 [Dysgonamonadaceae bacterium]|jgi:hypothetical protein|nr:hypothetical protein [Dysgonamonadaceae bacterium]
MKKLILLAGILACTCGNIINAQEGGLNFSVGADLVSSYVWRGTYSAKASFQPTASLSAGNFSLSAWASTDIATLHKEVDFTLGYSIGGLSLAITDYWWKGEGAFKYFNYGDGTEHFWEGSLGYTLPAKSFPLSLSVNTMFAGADKKEDKENNFSTYIEASLPFAIKDVNLNAALGLTPSKGLYGTEASVVNVSLKAGKEIKITDNFSLPVFGQIILNPNQEDVFFVFGISL